MNIASWFLIENFSQNERYLLSVGEVTIKTETEKAILIKVYTDYGVMTKWIPKSVIATDEEVEKILKEENEKRQANAEYRNELINIAKENKLSVGCHTKTKTIVKKLIENSLFEKLTDETKRYANKSMGWCI